MKFDMKNYYTAKEAQERLGIDKNRFNYLVRIKKIKKFIPPKRVQGVYSKLEIDKLARELIAFMVHDESQGLVFSKATKEDIEEEYELAAFMFGSSAVHSIPTRQAWLKANPDTDFIIRDQGRLVGFINMLPIKHETIVEFMAGRMRGWDIKPEDIVSYTPRSTVECIIMGMGTTPEVPVKRRTQYGARLISGLMEFLNELAQKQVTISKFYATSATPSGIALLKNAEFKETGSIGKRVTFELDTTTRSDTLMVREYRRMLEAYKG